MMMRSPKNSIRSKIAWSAEKTIKASYALCPIIAGGDAVGSLILISTKEALQDPDFQIIKLAANFLARHIEQ